MKAMDAASDHCNGLLSSKLTWRGVRQVSCVVHFLSWHNWTIGCESSCSRVSVSSIADDWIFINVMSVFDTLQAGLPSS